MQKRILFIAFIYAALLSCQPDRTNEMKKKEKILRINISREPTTLDPRKVSDPSHQAVISMLYEGLTKLNSDLTVSLAQAESYETSPDRLTYIFRIGNHRWSDGSEVLASDFEKTFLDLINPKFPAPRTHLLYCIKNAEECKKGNVPLKNVGIRSLDAKTIEFTLERPCPVFLQILATTALVPYSSDLYNGPYILDLWNRQVELKLRPNPYYSEKKGHLDAIEITMIDNEISALHMYASEYLDIIGTPFSQIPLAHLKELKQKNLLKIQPVAASLFCAFNTESPLFQNVNLRKAFATATNRCEIIEHITLLDDEPGLSAIPSILKQGRSKAWIQDGDVEKAKEYLDLALSELDLSIESLPKITLHLWPFELNYRISQTLQDQWHKALGIRVHLETIDFKSLLAKAADGSYQMGLFAWSADYGDPLALLNRFRLSTDAKNHSHWHSAKFAELLDASSEVVSPNQRLEILEEAEGILMNEMPIAPIFHWSFPVLVQPHVSGFSMNPLGAICFEELSVN